MLEAFYRSGKSPDDVKVGGLGGHHCGQSGIGGLAIQSGAADAGACEEVGDGLHACSEP
jgi:hypothetical protein